MELLNGPVEEGISGLDLQREVDNCLEVLVKRQTRVLLEPRLELVFLIVYRGNSIIMRNMR